MGKTESVSLRHWAPTDGPSLRRAYTSTPDLSTQFGDAALASDDDAVQFITSVLGFDDSAQNWAIVHDGIAVGNVGLGAIEWHHQTAWAYYWLTASSRGRGYAARALCTVADQGLRDGLERIELGHRVNNPASCSVATRAGFLAEGIERQKLRYGNQRFDVELHARLHTDPAPAEALARISMSR